MASKARHRLRKANTCPLCDSRCPPRKPHALDARRGPCKARAPCSAVAERSGDTAFARRTPPRIAIAAVRRGNLTRSTLDGALTWRRGASLPAALQGRRSASKTANCSVSARFCGSWFLSPMNKRRASLAENPTLSVGSESGLRGKLLVPDVGESRGRKKLLVPHDREPRGREKLLVPRDGESREREELLVPHVGESRGCEKLLVPDDGEPRGCEELLVPDNGEPRGRGELLVPHGGEPREREELLVPNSGEPRGREELLAPDDGESRGREELLVFRDGESPFRRAALSAFTPVAMHRENRVALRNTAPLFRHARLG